MCVYESLENILNTEGIYLILCYQKIKNLFVFHFINVVKLKFIVRFECLGTYIYYVRFELIDVHSRFCCVHILYNVYIH